MAGRDLTAFIFYRCRKFLRGAGRRQLRPRPVSRQDAEGPFSGTRGPGSRPFEADLSPDQSGMPKVKIEGSHNLQPGTDGGKTSDWMPVELDLQSTREAGRLIKKLVTPISRRRKQGRRRKALDVRATIHRNMHNQGTLLKMCWRMRKPARPRVVLILDTSSSMINSAKMMLQFLYALQHELQSIEVFIFGNQLNHVTPYLQPDFEAFLNDLSKMPQWNFGGTELWRPLSQLRKNYAHLLTARTTVIILTDCMLYEKFFALAPLNNLRRRVKRLYLFNPDPRTRDLDDFYYQETISSFKTVVDRMFYTETIYDVAAALRKLF